MGKRVGAGGRGIELGEIKRKKERTRCIKIKKGIKIRKGHKK